MDFPKAIFLLSQTSFHMEVKEQDKYDEYLSMKAPKIAQCAEVKLAPL